MGTVKGGVFRTGRRSLSGELAWHEGDGEVLDQASEHELVGTMLKRGLFAAGWMIQDPEDNPFQLFIGVGDRTWSVVYDLIDGGVLKDPDQIGILDFQELTDDGLFEVGKAYETPYGRVLIVK